VRQRASERYAFTDRGMLAIKGKGEMRTWLLTGTRASPAAGEIRTSHP